MKFDRADIQIFANYCIAAAESMAFSLIRTAHSTFVKETEDFSCTLMTPNGLTFATPKTLGATWYPGLDFGPAIRLVEEYEPGDVCMTNDPYSGFVATHTPDVAMWKPVFHEGKLICFVGGHIHNTDMGGAVPASLSRSLTEVQQEGIRFPPSKILRRGKLDAQLLALMMTNVRAPEQNRGDLQAQLASLATGERKVLEIVERFGVEYFSEGIEALLDYSEAQARSVVQTLQNGSFFFADYADEDSVGGEPMRIALNLTVRDGALELDFSGSDPQLTSSLNVPTGGHERHVLILVGLNYVLYSLNPSMLLNAGMLRVARCILPKGSVLNPEHPAAVGMRSLTCMVLQHAILGAFAQAAPDRLPACPSTGLTILNVRTMDSTGGTVMASIGPIGGGAGASSSGDGSDACGAYQAFLRNTPVEINEAEVPIRIRRYGLVPGSAGPGRTRGGSATAMEFQVFTPNTMVTARNRNGSIFGAWGLLGGKSGARSVFLKNPGLANEEDLGNTDLVSCDPGDIILCQGGGGGGYGDPLARDESLVLRDVRQGLISAEQARSEYGVAVRDGLVDSGETARLRERDRGPALTKFFDFGPRRDAHESIWTRERYDALSRRLSTVPVSWRFFLKHKVFERLEDSVSAAQCSEDVLEVDHIFDSLLEEFPSLRPTEAAIL